VFRRNFAPHSQFDDTVDPDRLTDLDAKGRISGHGTHVAGLAAAARAGNQMHGVAFDAIVLPLRTSFSDEELDRVYSQAILGGAKVLNGSYGPPARPEMYLTDEETEESYPNPNYQRLDHFPVMAADFDGTYT